jgi:D-amino-acid oxidase
MLPSNPAEEREHQMSVKTFERITEIHKTNPEAGITFLPGIEYFEAPSDVYKSLTEAKAKALGMVGFRFLKPEEFPDGRVTLGYAYDTWCVNPMVYCSFLLRRFIYKGGRVVKKEIRDPAEVFSLKELDKVDLVVNASGNGFNDENVFITRGKWSRRD